MSKPDSFLCWPRAAFCLPPCSHALTLLRGGHSLHCESCGTIYPRLNENIATMRTLEETKALLRELESRVLQYMQELRDIAQASSGVRKTTRPRLANDHQAWDVKLLPCQRTPLRLDYSPLDEPQ